MKKLVAILTVLATLLTTVHHVCAIEELTDQSRFKNEAEKFICETVYLNSENNISEASSIALGTQIPSYTVDDTNLNELTESVVSYYPVIAGSIIIGLLGVYDEGGQFIFSYTESCAGDISQALEKSNRIAIIWIDEKIEIVVPSDLYTACSLVDNEVRGLSFSNPFDSSVSLSLYHCNNGGNRYLPSSYALSVDTKLQSYNWDCWAACAACVGKYHTGLDYSSFYVANAINHIGYGYMSDVQNALSSVYNYTATLITGQQLTFADTTNIIYNQSKPIIVEGLNGGSVGHTIVIYGYATGTYYSAILIMDPSNGEMTVSYTISLVNGTTPCMTIILSGYTYYLTIYEY